MLHAAAQNGRFKLAELLLAQKADPRVRSDKGKTAIDFASQFKYDPVPHSAAAAWHVARYRAHRVVRCR